MSITSDNNTSLMEEFLEHSRNGNVNRISEIINQNRTNNIDSAQFDINYRGKHKRFYGWTALHISCYFNKIEIVKLLIKVFKFIIIRIF